ncbi:hypothetical protein Nepgr_033748 [Nepenthes gracilis]|uniref:Uncharacterized protein n=1 Tax=Nepenthes gracilis TaxID=150966 RepID=A0AAD3Y8V6_NEPGR|nr:hypothetical protein Nepgr_033748 [Nepenthes gracilis]
MRQIDWDEPVESRWQSMASEFNPSQQLLEDAKIPSADLTSICPDLNLQKSAQEPGSRLWLSPKKKLFVLVLVPRRRPRVVCCGRITGLPQIALYRVVLGSPVRARVFSSLAENMVVAYRVVLLARLGFVLVLEWYVLCMASTELAHRVSICCQFGHWNWSIKLGTITNLKWSPLSGAACFSHWMWHLLMVKVNGILLPIRVELKWDCNSGVVFILSPRAGLFAP